MRIALVWGAALLVAFPLLVHAQSSAKIDAALHGAHPATEEIEFLVTMRVQADLSGASRLGSKADKGRFVYETLKSVADRTQRPVVEILREAKAPFHSYYLANAIWVRGDMELARKLAALPEVARIMPNPPVRLDEPIEEGKPLHTRNAVEWGIAMIRADQVWAMGYTGQGAVIAGQDTGYDWDHPALIGTYRGWDGLDADHNYHWHDAIHELNPLNGDTTDNPMNNPCGLDSPFPCDDGNHGTHTMGIMTGDDGQGNQVGVAPGAQWIACRNMERGWGSPATYLECFEWFLAPTDLNDENPDPAKAPHVINNSWRCPEIEGCTPSNWALMDQAIGNLRAAGVVVVVSAGNSGSSCGSVNAPPAIFEGSFAVGATRQNDTIAGFSSRGLVTVDSSFRLKPDVAAPGAGIRSSIPGGGYANLSGTSMSGPHVAGLVALIISANPALAGNVDAIEQIIRDTAVPKTTDQTCGDIPGSETPNPVYGYGRVDALAAVLAALALTATPQLSEQPAVRVFPNPTSGRVFLSADDADGRIVFQLFSPAGQLLLQHQWQDLSGPWLQPVDLSALPAGLYVYRIATDQSAFSGRILQH